MNLERIDEIIVKNITITDQSLYEGVFNAVLEAVNEENEACAAVCERLPETFKIAADEFGYQAEMPTAENYAAAIRARGEI